MGFGCSMDLRDGPTLADYKMFRAKDSRYAREGVPDALVHAVLDLHAHRAPPFARVGRPLAAQAPPRLTLAQLSEMLAGEAKRTGRLDARAAEAQRYLDDLRRANVCLRRFVACQDGAAGAERLLRTSLDTLDAQVDLRGPGPLGAVKRP